MMQYFGTGGICEFLVLNGGYISFFYLAFLLTIIFFKVKGEFFMCVKDRLKSFSMLSKQKCTYQYVLLTEPMF